MESEDVLGRVICFIFLLLNEADSTDFTSQPRCPGSQVTSCALMDFCLSVLSLLPLLHSSSFFSAPNHMFLQTILSRRIDCHKIIWFKVMRLQVLLFFLYF